MPLPLLPLAVAGLAGAAWWRHSKQPNVGMTPQRTVIFETMMKKCSSPDDLNMLADAFQGQGLLEQAAMLRKRAALRAMPPEVKKARRDAFEMGMKAKDAKAVFELADAFEEVGAYGSAEALRKRALGLESGTANTL